MDMDMVMDMDTGMGRRSKLSAGYEGVASSATLPRNDEVASSRFAYLAMTSEQLIANN